MARWLKNDELKGLVLVALTAVIGVAVWMLSNYQ